LTGTTTGPQGDTMPVNNGKVDGSKVSFTITVGDSMTITYEGTVNDAGDQIKMTMKAGEGMGGEFILKKSK
jgi:hypothetical protein